MIHAHRMDARTRTFGSPECFKRKIVRMFQRLKPLPLPIAEHHNAIAIFTSLRGKRAPGGHASFTLSARPLSSWPPKA